MKIAIIGSGKIGSTLAIGLANAGHQINIGTRQLDKDTLKQLAESNKDITIYSILEAVKLSEVIIISVPFIAVPETAILLGNTEGKIIIETTNAFGKKLENHSSGTTAIKSITGNEDVVKCFSCIGFEDLANPSFKYNTADMFVGGNSANAKLIAKDLSKDLGFAHCYDLGGDESLPILENLAQTWGALAFKTGLGRRIAFKILTD
jgi:8-hydroxy-5-deazaflavin:NADPH oxidoreductase